ncbi:MAG: EAL domain-containing protein [Cyanobacteria bacterium J06555_3]
MIDFKLLVSRLTQTFNLRLPARSTLLITSLIVLAIGGVRQSGNLEFLELAVFDLMMRSRGETASEQRITVVAIEESDLKTWQQSTFSDRSIAQLLAKLQSENPAVIGLDIYRDIAQPPGNSELRRQLAAANIIAIEKIDRDTAVPPPPGVPPERIGFNNFLLDRDGILRRSLIAFKLGKQSQYSFALQVSKVYLKTNKLSLQPEFVQLDETIFTDLRADSGGYQLSKTDVRGTQILLDYPVPNQAARKLSFSQVIDGDYDPSWIKNQVVIVGYTAPSKKDLFQTPFGGAKTPGVIIHAHMVSQILNTVLDQKPLWRFLPQWSEFAWIWLWSIGGAILVWRIRHPLVLGASLIATSIVLVSICWLGFVSSVWIPATPAILGLLSTTGAILASKTFYSSLIDELTGLANQEQLLTLLQQTISKPKKSTIAVLSINIARLKKVNDSLGASASNRILILATARIQSCIRSGDRLARVGATEFSLVLFPISDRNYALETGQRIQQELAQPFEIASHRLLRRKTTEPAVTVGQEIVITTNLGIAFCQPEDKIPAEALLRNSNLAQERAEIQGKNQCVVFLPRMLSETVAQWQLENDLRRGIENCEFEMYYQPIINLKTDRLAGFEALVRWQSPTRGFVSPAEFIPLSETIGLIVPLGSWILGAACRQMQLWQEQFNLQNDLTISINLSSQQFQASLLQQVANILAESGLKPQCLKLEITESAMMDDVESAIALLQELKSLGIKLSVDDFGTGYSSLSYLQQFCADTLKIDQSFVSELELSPRNEEIVDIIITLAHKLDMDVIAEGIENAQHEAILKALNCEYGQGFFFSKPLNINDATELLAQEFVTTVEGHEL